MSDAPKSRKARWRRNMIVASVAFTFLGSVNLIYFLFFQTYHFVEVDPGKLYRDGNRSLREFKHALSRSKARTVIAVIDHQEYNEEEFVAARELLKTRGIEFHWIPIKAGAYPTGDQVREFLALANNPAKQPVLYHDDEGIRRAGMMMAAYQQTVLGYDDAKTIDKIQAFGHSDRTINDVRRFIEAYDPVAGLTVDLNPPSATTSATQAAAGE